MTGLSLYITFFMALIGLNGAHAFCVGTQNPSTRSQLVLVGRLMPNLWYSSTADTSLRRRDATRQCMISNASASSQDTGHAEMLMKISFSMNDGISESESIDLLRSYIASFPFSAVLPVQPLTYLPRVDGNGVDVSFLRKKTPEKGSIDGGIEFLISSKDGRINLVAMRNAEGQTVSKVFTEGLIIKSFVSGIYGDEDGRTGIGRDELLSKLSVETVLHKWM